MKKIFYKKNIIIISILSALILAIIIFLIVFYNHGNIPKKYRGKWVLHTYYLSDSDELDKTFTLEIKKNSIASNSTTTKLEYEIDGYNFIIVYVNPETNERFKEYVLLEGNKLYLSQDKKIDKLDICYYKSGSTAEKDNILQTRADYYASNIEVFANQSLKETIHSDKTISIININDLTEEQKNKKDDLNYYYAFYNAFSNTVEIAINRDTGKLANIKYTENLSITNDSNVAASNTSAALYGICCLIYADNLDIKNINEADELQKSSAKLYATTTVATLLKKATEEKSYITTLENDRAGIFLSSPIYKTNGEMSIRVTEK